MTRAPRKIGVERRSDTNVSRLTMSWYVNESNHPNVSCDEEYNFVALKTSSGDKS